MSLSIAAPVVSSMAYAPTTTVAAPVTYAAPTVAYAAPTTSYVSAPAATFAPTISYVSASTTSYVMPVSYAAPTTATSAPTTTCAPTTSHVSAPTTPYVSAPATPYLAPSPTYAAAPNSAYAPTTAHAAPTTKYQREYRIAREDPFFVPRSMKQIMECQGELNSSDRFVEVRAVIDRILEQTSKRPEELVCYCLGDLSELNVAFQLAFFLSIAHQFAIPPARRLVFDPVHTEKDKQLLEICGCTPMLHNEQALRPVHCCTLLYMPFADYSLTDDVLRTNWHVLDRVILIGNPLKWVASGKQNPDDNEVDRCTSRAPCAQAALKLATEVVLWDGDLITWSLAQAEDELGKDGPPPDGTKAAAKKELIELVDEKSVVPSSELSITHHALDASLAVFVPPATQSGWLQQPPLRRTMETPSRL